MARRRRHTTHRRHSTHHRKPHVSRVGRPHPHKGAHVPHPGARHPRHESAAQAAAARANLVKARAAARLAHPAGHQTPRQLAAERANLAKARAARRARRGVRMVRTENGELVPASFYTRKNPKAPKGYVVAANGNLIQLGTGIEITRAQYRALHKTTRKRATVHRPRVRKPRTARSTVRHVAGGGRVRSVSLRAHSTVIHVRHMPGIKGPKNHYDRRGLAKTPHWRSGHRAATHPKRTRWAWSVPGNKRHGWNWTRARKASMQW